ncbi:39s ribosomal protein l28 mitochondrial [Holotrichia oblita]|uniref:39s ribosomal protein l28 mitochondrial n=1 Tax=Holotrichia oblita TaxID=644536 RepID=A0ACB9TNY6_HOLOL|nr:39s ribosomal protein l28 mitochondrial [Holotrichia oblita]
MSNSVKTAGAIKKLLKFDKGIGACLPEAYKKFYVEWQVTEPTAVHYIPEDGKYKWDEIGQKVIPVQNIPIPVKFPKEHHQQLWAGEGVVQGFQKRDELSRRVPHFWIPVLKRSVVYSEVLDKYMSVVTPACDLKSLLAVGLKRMILQELSNGCPAHANNPIKQKEIIDRYTQYLSAYTAEEIEWYGYSFNEACKKMNEILTEKNKPIPLKHLYRAKLIEKLKAAQIEAADRKIESSSSSSWIQSINPFGKKHEA